MMIALRWFFRKIFGSVGLVIWGLALMLAGAVNALSHNVRAPGYDPHLLSLAGYIAINGGLACFARERQSRGGTKWWLVPEVVFGCFAGAGMVDVALHPAAWFIEHPFSAIFPVAVAWRYRVAWRRVDGRRVAAQEAAAKDDGADEGAGREGPARPVVP